MPVEYNYVWGKFWVRPHVGVILKDSLKIVWWTGNRSKEVFENCPNVRLSLARLTIKTPETDLIYWICISSFYWGMGCVLL